MLAYCNSCAEARKFCNLLNAAGISAAHFDGNTAISKREHIIREFRGGVWRVLVTVQTISEGVDIPEADTCMFVEPRGSSANVQQCVGRVLRLSPGKPISYVVLPSANEEAELSRFLRLMISHYERLVAACKPGRCGGGRISIVTNIADGGDGDNGAVTPPITHMYDRLGSLIDEEYLWNNQYDTLARFYAEEKKLPPIDTVYEKCLIGRWCDKQRTNRRDKKLSEARELKLNTLQYWDWGVTNDEKWNVKFGALQRYVAQYGRQPIHDTIFEGVKLGSWCSRQKDHQSNPNRASPMRKKLLESVPGWKWRHTT